MEKLTLKFSTLKDLTDFSKTLDTGFLINTKNLTLTTKISPLQVALAEKHYKASSIETTERVFSYDAV